MPSTPLPMHETTMPLYEIGALALTRAALGAGIGLLVAGRLAPRTRRVLGVALLAVGLASTVPVVRSIVHGVESEGVRPV
jgi:hypothetical protein